MPCFHCRFDHVIKFRRDIIHENNFTFGYLDLIGKFPSLFKLSISSTCTLGCRAFDILFSDFIGSCMGCSNPISMKSISVHTSAERTFNCNQCHQKVGITLCGVEFKRARTINTKLQVLPEKKKKNKTKDPMMQGIKQGVT